MALPTRRSYAGAADSCTLTSAISAGDTNASLTGTVTYWPVTNQTPPYLPFYMVIDPGLTAEEKVLVTIRNVGSITITRAQDGTLAAAHAVGAICYPVGAAVDFDEANSALSTMTTKGDLLVTTGSAYARLPVGTNTYSLLADSGAANGVAWGQIAAGGIATGAVTSAKILDATIVQADLALTLLKALCPVGSINAYAGAAAPPGWILCNGTAVVSGTHPELFALCATTPDLRGSFALGKTATGTGSTLLGTGGSTTILEANLPSHTHTNSTSFTGTVNQPVTTTSTAHTHSVTSNVNNVVFTGTPVADHVHSVYTEDKTIVNGADSNWGVPKSTAGNAYTTAGAGAHTPAGSVTLTNNAVTSGPMSANDSHNHTITPAGVVGVTIDPTGSGTAYYQPFLAVNYIIKHDYV